MKAKFKNLLESNYIIPIVAVVATNFNELKYLDESDVNINRDLFGVFMAYTPKDFFSDT